MKIEEVIGLTGQAISMIEKGAFLTVQTNDQINTMTIGWALMGICWRKPILMVAVRDSRYTFGLMEAADDFCVSVPTTDKRDEIFYCGTKSGRDVNKLEECGLTTRSGRQSASPIIDVPGLHIECRIVYKNALEPALLHSGYHAIYPEKDFHTLYFGEIVACYETT
jgi:flavin reductase (DIM6/NTAB) family NADH-FMN oxidoreductase RutF